MHSSASTVHVCSSPPWKSNTPPLLGLGPLRSTERARAPARFHVGPEVIVPLVSLGKLDWRAERRPYTFLGAVSPPLLLRASPRSPRLSEPRRRGGVVADGGQGARGRQQRGRQNASDELFRWASPPVYPSPPLPGSSHVERYFCLPHLDSLLISPGSARLDGDLGSVSSCFQYFASV